jgi:hypothetical protein
MIVREMARQAPDTLSRNAALVMPLAFTARNDEDSDVAELWKEVRHPKKDFLSSEST